MFPVQLAAKATSATASVAMYLSSLISRRLASLGALPDLLLSSISSYPSVRSLALFRVNESDEGLKNVENVPSDSRGVREFLAEGKFFQGGNAQMLHKLLQISAGDRLLYVGDHMYAGTPSLPRWPASVAYDCVVRLWSQPTCL